MNDVCLEYLPRAISLLSENSRRSINCVFSQWRKFLRGKPLAAATANDAMTWLESLRKKGLSDNTLRNRATHLVTLYEKFYDAGLIERNKIKAIRHLFPLRQKRLIRETRMLTKEQVCRVLNAPDPKEKDGTRDRAILALLFGAGLRRSEVQMLNLKDVKVEILDHEGRAKTQVGYIEINKAKSGTSQKQSFAPWVLDRLQRHIKKRIDEGAIARDPLFITVYRGGGRIDGRTIARRFQKHCRAAGVKDWIAPHSARATAASTLKADGHDDREVMHFLRHATPDMVRIYDKRARQLKDNPGIKLNYLIAA